MSNMQMRARTFQSKQEAERAYMQARNQAGIALIEVIKTKRELRLALKAEAEGLERERVLPCASSSSGRSTPRKW